MINGVVTTKSKNVHQAFLKSGFYEAKAREEIEEEDND